MDQARAEPGTSEPHLRARERALLTELEELTSRRAAAEADLDAAFRARSEALRSESAATLERITTRCDIDRMAAENEFQETRRKASTQGEVEQQAADKEFHEAERRIQRRAEVDLEAAQRECRDARWMVTTVFDASRNGAKEQLHDVQQRVHDGLARVRATRRAAIALVRQWKQPAHHAIAAAAVGSDWHYDDPLQTLESRVTLAETRLAQLRTLRLPGLFKGKRIRYVFFALWLLLLYPSLCIHRWLGVPIAAAAAALVGAPLALGLYRVARSRVHAIYQPLLQDLHQTTLLRKRCREQASAAYQQALAEAQRRHDADLARAEQKGEQAQRAIESRTARELAAVDAEHDRVVADTRARMTAALEHAEARHAARLAEARERYEHDWTDAQEAQRRDAGELEHWHERAWRSIADEWRVGLDRVRSEVAALQAQADRLFPAWTSPAWYDTFPATAAPPVLRFGELSVDLARLPGGLPADERLLCDGPTEFLLPALVPFPDRCSMLFRVADDGRRRAEDALRAVMLRLLTSVPPGKVRFTIIDPVGLGERFAAFMHLADYEESVVSTRIWTEPGQIEERLSDLTTHMENVIQKYLRNEFETIEQYNEAAGEVAEPFRFLVVANFPVNFTEAAARRLLSIASSGARCGVHTLITLDTRQPLPHGFDPAELERHGIRLVWRDNRFAWDDPLFGKYPLRLEAAPTPEVFTTMLQAVGENARAASRVEVPFEVVAPAAERWWTGDTSNGIRVPLGRAGATKLQYLDLGRGTAQHLLIAGKTGSGKSTLLHALITNLALLYSPDEVELYLVDFKKGVEFKTYATHELPHARVVAIESDREFGVSVLERLDEELRRRGDLFRELGVQDIAAYRQSNGQAVLPRILLVVDEFQEFFVEDDKIGQEAALLLDRLVRQGRAFGIHVLLGSQTLSGAYSLARSTIGQMAVRIALQSSETDAHLILSEDNPAARLLTRPGEAIYNDANGRSEGNNFFQVVWLPDERREEYLRRIQQLTHERRRAPETPAIVFEGNRAAELGKNHLLRPLLDAPCAAPAVRSVPAWLGEAIAIKEPTAAVFRYQPGSNLLIVGQNDEAALAVTTSAVVSLAAQHPSRAAAGRLPAARFCLLDGTRPDSPHAGWLARLAARLPHAVEQPVAAQLAETVAELRREVDRRLGAEDAAGPTIYLLVHDLGRFRALRRQDDDYSFARHGEEPAISPAQHFATILREGPAVGVHCIAWCDSLTTAHRVLDRQGLREFEMRVLFQMSAADSSHLIDSPVAGKLGRHRALYYNDEQGTWEKFRPYALPAPEWLAALEERLRTREASGAACWASGNLVNDPDRGPVAS